MDGLTADARAYVAEAALADALAAVGLSIRADVSDGRSDAILTTPGGQDVVMEVHAVALASIDGLERRLDRWRRASAIRSPNQQVQFVLVADRITASARDVLRAADWGWLDLRGHLHLSVPGVFVDADVPLHRTAERSTQDPFSGRVGIEVAVDLLLRPTEPVAVRRIASRIGRAPSTVSEFLARLRSVRLVDQDRLPRVPELFWDLVPAWSSESVAVASLPPFDRAVTNALRLGLDDIESTTGWAMTDSKAAAQYGAPIGLKYGHPEDFYVPDAATLRRAVQLLGPAADRSSRAATVRVAPVPVLCSRRVDATASLDSAEHWPLAQPLFVALDLAQDPGRGREVLDGWNPPSRWRRVW